MRLLTGTVLALWCALASAQGAPATEPAPEATTPEATAPPEAAPAQEPAPESVPMIPVAAEPEAPPAAPAPEGDATQLDQITVTAERKVATLQQTPISIEALNADKLRLRGIDGLNGIAANVPNLTVEPFPIHNATLRMFIRGEGTADVQLTQDPAVGVYMDGVYIARSVGLSVDTADLERIEVLRGPQGTLYGRNTTGGAINLVTKRPDPGAFTMAHQITTGSDGLRLGKSSINVPVLDTLAFKLAALGDTADGFVENTGLGGDFGNKREKAVRFDARWLPTDWLTADYSYDQTDLRYYGGLFQAILPPNTSHGLGDYFKQYAQSQTVYSEHRLDHLATGAPLLPSGSHIKGHALTLEAPLFGLDLKYIGAYRRVADDEYQDLGGGAGSTTYRLDVGAYSGASADMANGGPTPAVTPHVEQSQRSHELQVSGTAFETLEFIGGAFAFEETGTEDGHPLHHILNSVVDPTQLPPAYSPFFAGLTAPRLVGYWDYDYYIRNTARALFTQLTWSPDWLFERKLHLTGGLRKSWDGRHAIKNYIQNIYAEGNTAGGSQGAQLIPGSVTGTDDFQNVHGDREYSDLSPSAILRYDVSDTLNTYVSNTRAYKSGGFNVRDPQRDKNSGPASDKTNYGFGFAEGFRPEYVRSTEVGVKSEWFGHRLRFNADVFDSHLTDMQTNFLIAGSISDTKSRNVGKARMRGLETETAFVVWPGLVLGASYAHLDARVLEALDITGKNVAKFYPFPSAPPNSGVGSVDWTIFDLGWLNLRAYASYNYIGKRDGVVIVEERRNLTALYPVGLWNARLIASGVHLAGGSLEFALWGKNLADKEYPVFAIDNTPQADRSVLWGDPRTLGLDTVYRFY